jgi:Rrf2 family iron-sulfur cluster assembly transcriptional regulator
VIFSTPTEYAIRGLAELALRGHGHAMLLDQLVPGTGLPRDFLGKIFQRLVKAEILRSARGRGGGFVLARPAPDITLRHIVEALDGPQLLDGCVVGLEKCNDQMPCAQHDLFKPIRQRLRDYLDHTTLSDLAASLKVKAAWRKVHLKEELEAEGVATASSDRDDGRGGRSPGSGHGPQ